MLIFVVAYVMNINMKNTTIKTKLVRRNINLLLQGEPTTLW
jgi:hypothetical protein